MLHAIRVTGSTFLSASLQNMAVTRVKIVILTRLRRNHFDIFTFLTSVMKTEVSATARHVRKEAQRSTSH